MNIFARWPDSILAMRACLFCGSFSDQGSMLCRQCFRWTQSKMDVGFEDRLGFPNFWLWNWIRDTDLNLAQLFKKLKHHTKQRDWLLFAEMMVQKRLTLPRHVGGSQVLFFAPGSKPGSNHAEQLARAIGQFCGAEVRDVLRWPEPRQPQKQKKGSERSKIRMQRVLSKDSEKNSPMDLEGKTVIFVDDILTTGATARAAYIALGRPQRFEVWTLARRLLMPGVSV